MKVDKTRIPNREWVYRRDGDVSEGDSFVRPFLSGAADDDVKGAGPGGDPAQGLHDIQQPGSGVCLVHKNGKWLPWLHGFQKSRDAWGGFHAGRDGIAGQAEVEGDSSGGEGIINTVRMGGGKAADT